MLTWSDTQEVIRTKELARLLRSPEQKAHYAKAKQFFLENYGGTAEFVIKERLQWDGDAIRPRGTRFLGDLSDVKLLINDFSYDFEPEMHHFVVWSKLPIPCGPDDFPTPEATKAIESFIRRQFTERCNIDPENLQWFRNTGALQSIPSVSHFHVLVRHCDEQLKNRILDNLIT